MCYDAIQSSMSSSSNHPPPCTLTGISTFSSSITICAPLPHNGNEHNTSKFLFIFPLIDLSILLNSGRTSNNVSSRLLLVTFPPPSSIPLKHISNRSLDSRIFFGRRELSAQYMV